MRKPKKPPPLSAVKKMQSKSEAVRKAWATRKRMIAARKKFNG